MRFLIGIVFLCVGLTMIVQCLPQAKQQSVVKSSSLVKGDQVYTLEDFELDQDGSLYLNGVPLSSWETLVFQNTLEEEDDDYWAVHPNEFQRRYQKALQEQDRNLELKIDDHLSIQRDGSILLDGKIISEEELDQAGDFLSIEDAEYWEENPDKYLKALASAVSKLRNSNSTMNSSSTESQHSHQIHINKYNDVFIDGEELNYHQTIIFYQVYATKNASYWKGNYNELVEVFLENLEKYEEGVQVARFYTDYYYNGQQLTEQELEILFKLQVNLKEDTQIEDLLSLFDKEVKRQQGSFQGPFSNNTSITGQKGLVLVDFLDGVQLTKHEQDILTELQGLDEFLEMSEDQQVETFKEAVKELKKSQEINQQFKQKGQKHQLKTDKNKKVYLNGVQLSEKDLQLLDQVYRSRGQKYWKQNVDELCEAFIELKQQKEQQMKQAGKPSKNSKIITQPAKVSSQKEQKGKNKNNSNQRQKGSQ